MVMWPALSLIGFLALTALVIAMGTRTTARYEAEKQASTGSAGVVPEPVGAAATAAAAA